MECFPVRWIYVKYPSGLVPTENVRKGKKVLKVEGDEISVCRFNREHFRFFLKGFLLV